MENQSLKLHLTKLRDCKINDLKDPFLGRDYGLAFVISYMACAKEEITAKFLAEKMEENSLSNWERVFLATENNKII